MSPVKVISQQPPGGRCTLYARYADAIAAVLGWSRQVVHSECRDAHGEGFPSLWIGSAALQPGDGVILSPEDITAHLADMGVEPVRLDNLRIDLEAVLEYFLASDAA